MTEIEESIRLYRGFIGSRSDGLAAGPHDACLVGGDHQLRAALIAARTTVRRDVS
jgi:hypothetical protein